MISYLEGKIMIKDKGSIIVKAGPVGYRVYVNATFYNEAVVGQDIELFTHQYVREDSLDLFGFRTLEELEMFELLLSISGIGPKSALGVMAVANVDELKATIAHGDPSLLTKVSGIGKKTAERVILELKEKVGILGGGQPALGASLGNSEEIDALMALGYPLAQARDVLRQIDPNLNDSSDRIKAALKIIGR